MRQKLFSVTMKDCELQTFSAGGAGGQNQNRRSSGVRIIHHPSGSRGECREERSQLQNKKTAFKRMVETITFKIWVAQMTGTMKTDKQIEEGVDKSLAVSKNVLTEVKKQGKWVRDE